MPPAEKPFECLSLNTVGGFRYYYSTKKYLQLVTDHVTWCVVRFPSKSATTESSTNFLKQIFQIQVPEKFSIDKNVLQHQNLKKFFEIIILNTYD